MGDDKNNLKLIGDRLTLVRKTRGFPSREAFAEAFGIPKRTLEKYEQGVSELPTRLQQWLATVHGVNLTWLMTGAGDMFDDPSKAPPPAANFDIVLLQKLHDAVQAVYVECKRTPPPRAITADAGELYNELLGMVGDIRDKAVVTAVIPILRDRFKERISKAEPGSTKAVGS
ncbi:helix-turn-helix domain-containing protein [Rhizobium alvei]|uniref:Helix-turn-helix transcriptional regulator n=1 Tax=Rhizobium alvei TaxID=1132659 RepID=A0ABT8YUT4_9HYPH|nr:helix-turn-helix transcriptional regulator [Rhizobium alvei]MDO6967027.1 helix-turn-helix transcriptional regulator [Rhizobium alvei]